MHTKQTFNLFVLVALIVHLTGAPLASAATETDTLGTLPSLSMSGSGLDQKSISNAMFLLQIQQDLKKAYSDYHSINNTITDSQEKVHDMDEHISTLREQIISFQREIDLGAQKIKSVGEQVGLKEKELAILRDEVAHRDAALEEQKKILTDYMRILYIKEHRFSADGSGEVFSSAKLLLADGSVGDILQEMNTLDMLQHGGQVMLEKLAASEKTITDMQTMMEEKKARLDTLKTRLLSERQHLVDQQMAKAKLMELTHGQQSTYQKLIEDSQKQEDESLLEISTLQNNFNYIKDNLSKLGNSVTPTDLQRLLDQRTRELYEYTQQSDPNATLQWPVTPSRGISAYFHDSAYKARFGVGHQAIDIPTNQATQIHAPSDGIVFKAKDNGMGYSYIILSHKGNLMTVYGHVSSILVKEGQIITAGQVIGLTGGMPGTKGAGYMTTGPHLHLEVLKNGTHVDPLDYLPLTRLPLDSIPTKYADRVEAQRAQQVQRQINEDATGTDTGRTPEEIDAYVEKAGNDEIEAYRRIFGIPKESGSMQP